MPAMTFVTRRWVAGVWCVFSWAVMAAEGPAKDSAEKARTVYREAQKALTAGSCDKAVPKLEEGLRLLPVAKAFIQLGDCYAQLGRLDDASATYGRFLAAYPEHAAAEGVREKLDKVKAAQRQAQTRKAPAPLPAAPATSAPEGATAGAPPAGASARTAEAKAEPTDVKPAPVTALSAPKTVSGTTPVITGQHDLPKEAVASSDQTPPITPRPARSPRIWTWVAGGVAVAAVGAGFAFGQQSKSTADALRATEHSGAETQKLQADFRSQARTANILLGVGAGLVVLSATLFVLRF
jgi:tetratricopeptide (TPR) repeat protein